MNDARNIEQELMQFRGTERYYRHMASVYTEGVKYMADRCGAYWLLDVIDSYQHELDQPFQIWELRVDVEARTGRVTMKEDTDEPYLVEQEIPFTDFPLDHIKLWRADNVIMLPGEY